MTRKYLYVGMTGNLERRLHQHQLGQETTTSPYKPFTIVYTREHKTRQEARKHEKYLKSSSGKEWLKKHIAGVA